MKFWIPLVLAFLVALSGTDDVQAARRLGGGGSIGRQSPNVTQREVQRTAPTAPQQQKQATPAPQQPAPAAPVAPRRPWGAMLGGLAAGIGLAWLAHSLGLGEAFGSVLLVLLGAMLLMAVIGMVMRSRRPQAAGAYGYPGSAAPAEAAATAPQYNPEKIGNDASARPWERSSMAFDAARYAPAQGSGLRIGSALEGPQNWGVPPGFDTEGFLKAAKSNFITLQDAWDRADLPLLRSMMTDQMLTEIRAQLSQREQQLGGQPNRTEVVMLEAQLLGIEDVGDAYLASAEFSGLIREDPSAGPSPFREVWNMSKPKDGSSGWLVAGVQALQ